MAEEKISTLLSDVFIDGNMVEKNKIIVDAKVRGNIEANDLDTHSNSSIDGNIKCKNVSIGGKLKGKSNLFFQI